MAEKKPSFQTFNQWYEDNPKLAEDLQTWVFYSYAVAEQNFGQEVVSHVEVADMTVYLLLFYLSSLENNRYSITSSLEKMADILETSKDVVQKALESLQEHHLIHYHDHGDELHVTIEPVAQT